jgi:hypothetical protein
MLNVGAWAAARGTPNTAQATSATRQTHSLMEFREEVDFKAGGRELMIVSAERKVKIFAADSVAIKFGCVPLLYVGGVGLRLLIKLLYGCMPEWKSSQDEETFTLGVIFHKIRRPAGSLPTLQEFSLLTMDSPPATVA